MTGIRSEPWEPARVEWNGPLGGPSATKVPAGTRLTLTLAPLPISTLDAWVVDGESQHGESRSS